MSGAIEKPTSCETIHLDQSSCNSLRIPQILAHMYIPPHREIWEDMDGKVDVFIAGVGTGGTLSGVGEGLKQHNPQIEIIGVEPDSSAVLSGEKPGMHKIQGIGAGFIPKTFNRNVVDRIIRVTDNDAIRTGRELSLKEGLLTGISAGAATYAALQVASQPEYAGKNIVVLLPDTGEQYLSTALFAFEEYPLNKSNTIFYRIDNSRTERITNRFVRIVHFQFPENILTMGRHRIHTQKTLCCNLFCTLPQGHST